MNGATDIRSDQTYFGLELLSHAPNPADRQWVPLMKGVYTRYRFLSMVEAEQLRAELTRTQPHLTLRVVRLE